MGTRLGGRWMKRLVGLIIPLAALTAAACSQERIAEQMSSPEDRALASVAIKDIAQGDAADLAVHAAPRARAGVAVTVSSRAADRSTLSFDIRNRSASST